MPLLVGLIKSQEIVKLTVDSLSWLLSAYQIHCRKNASKTQKIRFLLAVPDVAARCTEEELTSLKSLLDATDEKNKRRAKSGPDAADRDDDLEEDRRFACSVTVHKVCVFEISCPTEWRLLGTSSGRNGP